jgi:hypothetical protein
MRGSTGLNDRIHNHMLASERSWTAEEMAEEFLSLRGGSAVALVRAVLRVDARFAEETPGIWKARRTAALPLRARSFAVAWVETGDRSRPDTWRVHIRPVVDAGDGGASARTEVLRPTDPAGWDAAFRGLGDRRIATLQPGLLGRIRQWMGRHHALGGDEDPLLDLQSLARLAVIRDGVALAESAAAARLPELFVRLGLGPVREEPEGVPLPAVELLLERLLELFGDMPEDDLLQTMEETLSPRPVPADRFEFTLADLESVPEGSGIYRFLGDGGVLLYVGKAVSLRRRIASYFRPLPPEPTRREELLRAIRRFEVKRLPSELEALLSESRAIREHRPPWNVQVEVRELEASPPVWWWPLIFVAPGSDPEVASVFLLTGLAEGYLFHVLRSTEAATDLTLAAWLHEVIAPGESVEDEAARRAGVGVLDEAEVRLAIRYYLRERDRLDRVDATDLTDGPTLAEALQRLAATPSGATGGP